MHNKIQANSNATHMNQEYELSLKDYLLILRIHIKKIIFISLLFLSYSIYRTYTIPPVYKATATVMIREKPGANLITELGNQNKKNRMINEIQLINSRALAKEVVKNLWESNRRNNLHVFGTRVFYPRGQRLRKMFKELFSFGIYNESETIRRQYDEPYTNAIGEKFSRKILNGMGLKQRKNTDILEISFKSVNADEAARIVNVIAKTYVRLDKVWSSQNAVQAVDFLENLASMQEDKLDESELRYKNFQIENNLYSVNSNTNSMSSEIANTQSEIYSVKAEINIRKEKIDILKSNLSYKEKDLTEQLLDDLNGQLATLRLKISELETKLIANKKSYGNYHEVVKNIESQIIGLKIQLNDRVKALIDKGITVGDPLVARQEIITELLKLDSELISLELRLSEMESLKNIFIKKIEELPQKQLELNGFERGIAILTKNYSYIREKLEEAKLNVAISVGNAKLVDTAQKPRFPISPNHNEDMLLGLVFGLILGIALAVLIELLDSTVKTIDDIEKYNLGLLGIIPSIGEVKNNKLLNLLKLVDEKKMQGGVRRRLITRENPKSPVSESYRSLRTNMLYSSSENEVRSILISSAGPGEGKTTTVANLAITYANLGKRTLLVDTDLRRPVVHKVFDLEREPGVTNYLSGQTSNYQSLVKKCEIDNLSIITSGIIPPNPSELLGSKRMMNLVKQLEEDWDMVLFDSPPLIAVTDANMIVKEIDQIVLVVKSGQTDKKAFHHTISNLKNIDAPIGGIIMNAVTGKSSYGSYYYYYYYQYNDYYGKD